MVLFRILSSPEIAPPLKIVIPTCYCTILISLLNHFTLWWPLIHKLNYFHPLLDIYNAFSTGLTMPTFTFYQSVLPKATEDLTMSISVQKPSIFFLSACKIKHQTFASKAKLQNNLVKQNNLLPVPHLYLAKLHSPPKSVLNSNYPMKNFLIPLNYVPLWDYFPIKEIGVIIPNT